MKAPLRLIGLAGRKRSGKDTVGRLIDKLATTPTDVTPLSFAGPMRDGIAVMFGIDMSDAQERETPVLLGVSRRHLMQTLGTEWGRQLIHPDLWLHVLEQRMVDVFSDEDHGDVPLVIVTDVRMPNEAELIRRHGGQVWRVERPGLAATDTHVSEVPLPDQYVDLTVMNTGTLEDLEENVLAALRWAELA